MKVTYDLKISIDLRSAIPAVDELCNDLNSKLSMFGMDEKLMIRSSFDFGSITSDRVLTPEEIDKMKSIVTEQFKSSHPAWNVDVTMIRRQSGNVQQSAIQ